ncbi:partial, partial [Paramuricea clavata]
MVQVVGRFMKELEVNNLDEDSIINEQEFRAVFENSVNLFPDDLRLLFGEDCEVMEAFAQVDRDDDGEITFQELMAFVAKRGVNLQKRFLGYTRKEIRNLGDFVQTLQTALAVNVKRVYVE